MNAPLIRRAALLETAKAIGPELYGALVVIRDMATQQEQPEQTRLNDIYDMATAALGIVDRKVDALVEKRMAS